MDGMSKSSSNLISNKYFRQEKDSMLSALSMSEKSGSVKNIYFCVENFGGNRT